MSLTVMKEPDPKQCTNVGELKLGTWFIDFDQQIYLVALDDRTHERRIICMGNYYHPFIVNVPMSTIDIDRILQTGTLFQITEALQGVLNHV